jgi:WD40 repeat protein/energy-coupling factor transporter ATP-binding protein EcfA2
VPALFSRLGARPLFSDVPDRPLTVTEIKEGIRFVQTLFAVRAPVWLETQPGEPNSVFGKTATWLEDTLHAEFKELGEMAQKDRVRALDELGTMCDEALDRSFSEIALGKEPPSYDARCPFLGLYPFRPKDRDFFFGRELLVSLLCQRLREGNFLAVLGPSGSGKSSLILAGLVPALQRESGDIQFAYLTPGSEPADLDAVLQANNRTSLLIVDQFEELFTLCTDDTRRRAFMNCLLQLPSRMRVVLAMRADFWGECAPFRELKERMQSSQELVAPMNPTELRQAMEKQAARVGLRFEADLGSVIMDEVAVQPGAMPLLQHSLQELWRRRHGRWLRATEYRAAGGVRSAIAKTAEKVYLNSPPSQQLQIKEIFLRLTKLGDETAPRDTRRQMRLTDLTPAKGDPNQTKALVARLANEGARLLVTGVQSGTGESVVQVAHEELIRQWPRLREWLDINRAELRFHESVGDGARTFVREGRKSTLLAHSAAGQKTLRRALTNPPIPLTRDELEYLRACRWKALKDTAVWYCLAALILLFVFLIPVAISLNARREAEAATNLEREQRERAGVASRLADEQKKRADDNARNADDLRRQLAMNLFETGIADCEQGRIPTGLLGLSRSYSTARAKDPLRATTLRFLGGWGRTSEITLRQDGIPYILAFSPDGKVLLTGGDSGLCRLWDASTGKPLGVPLQHSDRVLVGIFSPDGTTVVTASADKSARVWQVPTGSPLGQPLAHGAEVHAVAISRDGKQIATGSGGTAKRGRKELINLRDPNKGLLWTATGAQVWDAQTSKPIGKPLNHKRPVTLVEFSPSGKVLVTASTDHEVKLWDLGTSEALGNPLEHKWPVEAVSFTRDGKEVITVSHDTIQHWDVQTSARVREPLTYNGLTAVAFGNDIQVVLTNGPNGDAHLRDSRSRKVLGDPLPHGAQISNAAFSNDLKTVVTISGDEATARLWAVPTGELIGQPLKHQSKIVAFAISPTGQTVATGGENGTVRVWNLDAVKHLGRVLRHPGEVTAAAFSPDGQRVVTGSSDGSARIWQVSTRSPLGAPVHHGKAVELVTFGNDGATILTTGKDTARRWCVATGKRVDMPPLKFGSNVRALAISPDGRTIATGHGDGPEWVKRGDFVRKVERGKANLLEIATANQLGAAMEHESHVLALAFSPDGEFLVTGSKDRSAQLWQVPEGVPLGERLNHEDDVRYCQ